MTDPTIDEALAALEEIRDDTLVRNQGVLSRIALIRSALTAAAQLAERGREAKAWEAIEHWFGSDVDNEMHAYRLSGGRVVVLRNDADTLFCFSEGAIATRREALEAVAAWCKAAEAGKG